jgi:CSLREA domain-containing protein
LVARRRSLLAALLALGLLWPSTAFGAQFKVNSTADEPAAQPGDHVCRTAAGTCTLRAAIEAANAASGANTVIVPAGIYRITRPAKPPISQAVVLGLTPDDGYLLISGSVEIRGAGANRTVIGGGGLDRVFGVRLGATATLRDLTITGGDANRPTMSDLDIALGGGILNFGRLTLERVAIVRNHADGGGGVFTAPGGVFTIRDSLIADNTAVEGGGVRADTGGQIVNTTITGNVLRFRAPAQLLPDEISGYGGGIDHRGGDNLTIVNSTITDNHAYKAGGGLNSGQDYVPVGPLAPLWPFRVYLHNTIISGNTAEQSPGNCHVSAMIIQSQGHNLANDGSCFLTAVGDLPGRHPRLGQLADNGGPTRTQALLPGSPAIDAGSDAGCPATDQRGLARPWGIACDIGAFEYHGAATAGPACRRRTVVTLHIAGLRGARIHAVEATVDGRPAHVRRLRGRRVAVSLPRDRFAWHRIRLTIRYTRRGKLVIARQRRTVSACVQRRRSPE